MMLSHDGLGLSPLDYRPKAPISVSSLHYSIINSSSVISQLDALDRALEYSCIEPTPFHHDTKLEPLPNTRNVFTPTGGRDEKTPHSWTMEKNNTALLQDTHLSPAPSVLFEGGVSSSHSEPIIPTHPESRVIKFYLHQEDRWDELYEKLLRYKAEHGHCRIPQNFPEDLALARWVRRQRHQYTRKQTNKTSSMSDLRQQMLEDIGFVWDPNTDVWEIRRQELEEYKRKHGDLNVPSRFAENPQLASWVKRQRRMYKEMQEGRPSKLPRDRLVKLSNMGFLWKVRKSECN